jgi:hypothetical protein
LAIVVVGGSSKDIGKTALVCAIISALRDFNWTAVKITAHTYDTAPMDLAAQIPTIREETIAGQATDTARYLAAGARRALLVTRHGDAVPMDEIRGALGNDRNILFESNRIIDAVQPDVCIALIGGSGTEIKPSFLTFLRKADAVVSARLIEMESAELPADALRFEKQSPDHLTRDFVHWLRSRLSSSVWPDVKA